MNNDDTLKLSLQKWARAYDLIYWDFTNDRNVNGFTISIDY